MRDEQDGGCTDLARQIKYVLGDASARKELGGLMRKVVAVVVEQVIPARRCSNINQVFKTATLAIGHSITFRSV